MTSGPLVDARAAFLELGGRDATGVAAAIEQLSSIEAFKVMAAASLAARPQWAGLVDDLFDRPLLKTARAGLRNAFASTFTGDTLYRNVFFSFADAVLLWHYGYTQQRTGSQRLDTVYEAMLRLLMAGEDFLTAGAVVEPDVEYFHRLRKVRLTRDNAYPLLRRGGRLLGTVEAEVTSEKLHPVRGSILTSYGIFSAQVIAMSRARRESRSHIDRRDILIGLRTYTTLLETPPAALRI